MTLSTRDAKLRECQSLILAPTRELANQIQKVVIALADNMDISVHSWLLNQSYLLLGDPVGVALMEN